MFYLVHCHIDKRLTTIDIDRVLDADNQFGEQKTWCIDVASAGDE